MSFLTDSPSVATNTPDTCSASSAAREMLVRVEQLAVLPHVVFKVLELSGSEDSAASTLESAIMIDPAFSAKILALANSSYYGLSRKVTSIKDALLYIGFKSVRQMTMTIGIFDMFVGKNDKDSLRRRAWWRHSLDTAVCCQWLAKTNGKVDPADAYTCGILHYIGKTLLDKCGEADYATVEQRMALGTSDLDAEKRTYGCSHQDVAVEAALKWGLPASVIAGLHYTEPPAEDDQYKYYRAYVALAHSIAKIAVDGHLQPATSPEDLPIWAFETLGIPPSKAEEILHEGVRCIADSASIQF